MNAQELINSAREKLINIIHEKNNLIEDSKEEISCKEIEMEILEDEIMELEDKIESESQALELANSQLDDLMSKDFSSYSESQITRYFFGEDTLTLPLFETEIGLDVI